MPINDRRHITLLHFFLNVSNDKKVAFSKTQKFEEIDKFLDNKDSLRRKM